MASSGGYVPNPRLDFARPDPEDRNAAGYERLLDAVLCLLVESGTTALAEGFKPDDVAKRAGKSRASYYRTEGFPAGDVTNSEVRVAVLEAAIDRALRTWATAVNAEIEAVDSNLEYGRVLEDPQEAIRLSSMENFATVHNAFMSTRLYAAALAPSSMRIEASLKRHYDSLTDTLIDAYDKVLAFWGRRPKEPFDTRRFVIAVLALADGLILRYCADEAIDAELYAEILAAVAVSLLEPVPLGELPHTAPASTLPGVDVARRVESEWLPSVHEVVQRCRAEQASLNPLGTLREAAVTVAFTAVRKPEEAQALLAVPRQVDATPTGAEGRSVVALFEQLINEAALLGQFRAPAVRTSAAQVGRNSLFAQSFCDTLLATALKYPIPADTDEPTHAAWCTDYVWGLLVAPHLNVGA